MAGPPIKGRELTVLSTRSGKKYTNEKSPRLSVRRYDCAAEDFIPKHLGMGLFDHRGALTEVDGVTVSLRK